MNKFYKNLFTLQFLLEVIFKDVAQNIEDITKESWV